MRLGVMRDYIGLWLVCPVVVPEIMDSLNADNVLLLVINLGHCPPSPFQALGMPMASANPAGFMTSRNYIEIPPSLGYIPSLHHIMLKNATGILERKCVGTSCKDDVPGYLVRSTELHRV